MSSEESAPLAYSSGSDVDEHSKVPAVQVRPRPQFVRSEAVMGNLRVDPETAPKKGGRPRGAAPKPKLEAQAEQRHEFLSQQHDAPPAAPVTDLKSEHREEYTDSEILTVLAVGLVGGLALAYLGWRASALFAPPVQEAVKKAARSR